MAAASNSPKKSKKKSGFKTLLSTLFSLGVLGACAVGAVGYWAVFMPTHAPEQTLTIEKGDTFQSVLTQKSWQNNPLAHPIFGKLYLKFAVQSSLHTGTYHLPANASFKDAVQILQSAPEIKMVKLQIIEGKTVKDLYHAIKTTEGVSLSVLTPKQDTYTWADVAVDNKAVGEALGIETVNGNLEGWFAPDTYHFAEGVSDVEILSDLYHKQKARLENAWQTRADGLPYQTMDELLTMASIIEKETGVADERDKVSAVFVNRLRKGMRLQTDPTIIYGLFDRYDGKIYKSNIAEKTDYNTYQIDGLPPTPIALPSLKAVEAAAHPADTDVIFFVATGTGGHTFTRTLDEHNKAVAEYRRVIAEQSQNATNQESGQ